MGALAAGLGLAGVADAFFGELDPSFDGDGKVITGGPGNGREEGEEMVIQSDGKIVVAGWTDTDPTAGENLDFAVLRYNTDGSLDSSFDGDSGAGNGIVTIPFGSGEDDG